MDTDIHWDTWLVNRHIAVVSCKSVETAFEKYFTLISTSTPGAHRLSVCLSVCLWVWPPLTWCCSGFEVILCSKETRFALRLVKRNSPQPTREAKTQGLWKVLEDSPRDYVDKVMGHVAVARVSWHLQTIVLEVGFLRSVEKTCLLLYNFALDCEWNAFLSY